MKRTTKKLFALLLIATLLLAPMGVYAQNEGTAPLGWSGQTAATQAIMPRIINDRYLVGDLWYKEIGPGKVQLIGRVTDPVGTLAIPADITANGKPFAVTTIGVNAFVDCGSLTSVTIPDSVTTIGEGAFANCGSLTAVTIPDSVTTIGAYAFTYCGSMAAVMIPDSVRSIGDFAFAFCGSLAAVTIPDSVTAIGESAFANCGSLSTVTLPNAVTVLEANLFSNCFALTSITIPDSVTSIGLGAFQFSNLSSVTIPNSVTSIGDFAFAWNNSSSVAVPASVDSIGNMAFEGVSGSITAGSEAVAGLLVDSGIDPSQITLSGGGTVPAPQQFASGPNIFRITDTAKKEVMLVTAPPGGAVTIPKTVVDSGKTYTVTAIGRGVFQGHSAMTSVTIPDTVTSIGAMAFLGCTGLTSVAIPDAVASIGAMAFLGCTGLTSVTIPDAVTAIGDSAFEFCTGLTSVTIPDSVTSIGSRAFARCSGLTSVTIPDSVTSIGSEAFLNCTGLMSVNIPDSVTSIEAMAFSNCINLTSVNIPDAVTSIDSGAFAGSGLTYVTIPGRLTHLGAGAFDSIVTIHCHDPATQLLVNEMLTQNTTPTAGWNGKSDIPPGAIVTIDKDITVTGNVSIGNGADVTIPSGVTVTIDSGATLTIDSGATVAGTGKIVIEPGGALNGSPGSVAVLQRYSIAVSVSGSGTVTADKASAMAGETVTLTATPAGGHYLVSGSLKMNGMEIADNSFTMPAQNVTVTAQFSPVSSGRGSSSGGSSSNGKTAQYTAPTSRTLGKAEMQKLLAAAQGDVVRTSSPLSTTVEKDAWKLLDGYRFVARTSTDKAVQVQLTFADPAGIKLDMKVSGWVKGMEVDSRQRFFEKWFENEVRVIHLEHAGGFGQPVEVAAKVELAGMDFDNLVLYSYSPETNSYKRLADAAPWIDKNGYLHFTTEVGGDIIASDGALARR